ncbi:class I histocompatibility antigen, F10 alpha chain-like [Phyllopteryx taeniolatus]|uniref:class I histocompatibility antigen, F10 alpha chain-like n=1 Tax=Phyllopteryx taeniolatus TaxID=161469 RepID=UPI002AD26812|nr:class I histocompatibility antigen, F10 alpha chain-like [Phyllopteryx taeniolatus]
MLRMNLLAFFVAALQIHSVTPVSHTLSYFMTCSQVPNLSEYFEVAYVDGVPILHYDSKSRKTKAKQDWMKKITADDPHFWERETESSIGSEQVFKSNIEIVKERFNQTGGVHMFQQMYGCEWDDETGEVDGWEDLSYDGEAFISMEVKAMRWIAAQPQAFVTKLKLDRDERLNQQRKHILTRICPSYLKKHVANGRDVLMRTELPTVSLLQKTPSSPVTCHATGFYPSAAALFWRKDGEELHEDVEMGETLPNPDGTFQTTADLKAEVTDEAEGRYECVFQLSAVKDDIVAKLERRSIRSNARIREEEKKKTMLTIIAVAVAVLSLVAVTVAVGVVIKRNRSGQGKYSQASVSNSSAVPDNSPSPSETQQPSRGVATQVTCLLRDFQIT